MEDSRRSTAEKISCICAIYTTFSMIAMLTLTFTLMLPSSTFLIIILGLFPLTAFMGLIFGIIEKCSGTKSNGLTASNIINGIVVGMMVIGLIKRIIIG